MVSIAGRAVAADFGINVSAAGFGVFVFLQNQRRRTLAQHETAASAVEGQRSRVGVRGGGQSLHIDEARQTARADCRFRTAGDDRIGIAVTDGTQCLTDGVGAGGTGRHCRHGCCFTAEANGDLACRHVWDHHGHKQRRHAARALLTEFRQLTFDGFDAADAGAEVHAEALPLHAAHDAALLHSLCGRRNGILGIAVGTQLLGFIHILAHIEVFHLCRQFCFEIACIEAADLGDAVNALLQILPAFADGISNG